MKTVFLRVLDADDKGAALRAIIADPEVTQSKHRFKVDVTSFGAVPRSPFAYWLSERLRRLFVELPSFEASGRGAIGASTKNDFRFIRLATEVLPFRIAQSRSATYLRPWVSLSKGGEYSHHYSNIYLVVNWRGDGRELKANISEYRGMRGWGYQWSAALNGHSDYFRPGLTWPRRRNGLSFRVMPAGCIFGDKGPGVFVADDDHDSLLALSAIANSSIFSFLVSLQLARTDLAPSYEVGIIHSTPTPRLDAVDRATLSGLVRRAWSLKRSIDSRNEFSHAFTLPALLQVAGDSLATRADTWTNRVCAIETEIAVIHSQIDEQCFDLYSIEAADRRAITEGFGDVGITSKPAVGEGLEDEYDNGEFKVGTDPSDLAAELVSWAVGVVVGRFDVRLATGQSVVPAEPHPFDRLRVSSPGMLTDDEGLPLVVQPVSYPVEVLTALVSDPGHSFDIRQRVRSVFDVVFGEDSDRWWTDVGIALDAKGGETGSWLNHYLFDYHLKMYSMSRRKAPIVWPIGTRSGSYLVWLYAHNVSEDSLFRVLNDLLVPKMFIEERALSRLRQEAGPSPTASLRRAIDTQQRLLSELREFRQLLETVASLWAPDLDDGVVLVLAPLWRLFAHHRAWSTELRKHWVKLEKGDYDWAQIAMHLWPERVLAKCSEDRSIAIAHGLEDTFWVAGPTREARWSRRAAPVVPVEELVAQHRNPAVSAALERMNSQ